MTVFPAGPSTQISETTNTLSISYDSLGEGSADLPLQNNIGSTEQMQTIIQNLPIGLEFSTPVFQWLNISTWLLLRLYSVHNMWITSSIAFLE